MLVHQGANLFPLGRRQLGARLKKMTDFPENPGSSLRSTVDHHGINAGIVEDIPGLLRAVYVAIGDNRNRYGLLNRPDSVVLRFAPIEVGTGTTMHGRAAIPQSSAIRAISSPLRLSGSHPVRIFKVTGTSTASTTARQMVLTRSGWRSRAEPASFLFTFCRTSHVDVDDLSALLHIVAGSKRHHLGVGSGNLDRSQATFCRVIHSHPGFLGIPDIRVGQHLGNGHAGAQSQTKFTKWSVCYTGHRSHNQGVSSVWGPICIPRLPSA